MMKKIEAQRFIEVKNQISELKKEEAMLKEKLISHFNEESINTKGVDGFEIKVSDRTRRTFNSKLFQVDNQDLYEQYLEDKTSTYVTVTKVT